MNSTLRDLSTGDDEFLPAVVTREAKGFVPYSDEVLKRKCRLATLAVRSTEDSAAAKRKTKATEDLQLLRTLMEGWQTAKDEAAREKQRLIDLEKQQAADLVAAETQRSLELQAATDAAAAAKKAVGNALDDASKAKLEREAAAADKLLKKANSLNKTHDDGVRTKARLEEKARLRAVAEAAKKAADDAKNIAVNKILHDYASVYAAYLKSHQDVLAEFQGMPGRPGRHSIDLAIVDAPWKPQLNDWTPKECTEVRDTMDYFLKDGGYIILFDKGSNLHRWIDIFRNKKLPPGGGMARRLSTRSVLPSSLASSQPATTLRSSLRLVDHQERHP